MLARKPPMATNEKFQHLLEGAVNATLDKKLKEPKRAPRKVSSSERRHRRSRTRDLFFNVGTLSLWDY